MDRRIWIVSKLTHYGKKIKRGKEVIVIFTRVLFNFNKVLFYSLKIQNNGGKWKK